MDENCSTETVERWDSLTHIEIIVTVEEEFGIKIPQEKISNIIKNIMVVTNVASNLYLTFPVYVWLGTLNRLANHLPMSVNGTKLEIINERVKAIAKLTEKLTQSMVLKLMVKTPESRFD